MAASEPRQSGFSKALDASLSKPFIKGMICSDTNGLLIAAKGELSPHLAGRFSSISHLASSLSTDHAPTVIIETTDRKIVVKDYDSMTIALRCKRIEK